MIWRVFLTLVVLAVGIEGYWLSTVLLAYPNDAAVFGGVVATLLTAYITGRLLISIWRTLCADLFEHL